MKHYKAKHNEILDETGQQVAVILPTTCPKSMARRMAQYIVDRLNADERGRAMASGSKRRLSEKDIEKIVSSDQSAEQRS